MRRENLVLVLSILVIILGIITMYKYNFITSKELLNNKELVTVFKDLITILALIIGALLSYFRFFSGRTFSTKADIELEVNFIETPNNLILHSLTISIVNKGNLTIWEPKAIISVQELTNKGKKQEEILEQFLKESYFKTDDNANIIIDSGEKAYFTLLKEFSKSTWAVTYTVEVINDKGRTWQKAITVQNKITQEV